MARGSISVVLVRPLALALGGHVDAFFAATDLTPAMLADADARVSPAQFCVAWAEAVRATDRALALTLAAAIPQGAFGMVEYVCRSAPTMRAALAQWVRYLGLLDSAVEVGLVEIDGGAALRVLRESEAPAPASHELCFALVVRHARAIVRGGFRASRVRFAHAAPASHAAACRAFFGCDVAFDAPATELVVPSAVLDAPLSTADPNLLELLLPTAEQRRAKPEPSALLADQVRRALRAALSHDDAQLEAVAARLGVTARTLQRRLRDEGLAFQALRDEVRRDLADRYIGEGMSLAEVSFLLGFSEPSAFFRAFKRWTGVTPLERRAALA